MKGRNSLSILGERDLGTIVGRSANLDTNVVFWVFETINNN